MNIIEERVPNEQYMEYMQTIPKTPIYYVSFNMWHYGSLFKCIHLISYSL